MSRRDSENKGNEWINKLFHIKPGYTWSEVMWDRLVFVIKFILLIWWVCATFNALMRETTPKVYVDQYGNKYYGVLHEVNDDYDNYDDYTTEYQDYKDYYKEKYPSNFDNK